MKIDLKKVILIQWIGGFNKSRNVGMLDIINWGEPIGNDSVRYLTKDGEQIKKLSNFNDGYVKIAKIEEIDIKDSLHWWYKEHPSEYNKPLVLDETLEAGERYFGNCWRLGLLLASTETEVKYNFIFPK